MADVIAAWAERYVDLALPEQAPASDNAPRKVCLLYTSDAADERSSVDLGGRRIIKKKTQQSNAMTSDTSNQVEAHQTQATT